MKVPGKGSFRGKQVRAARVPADLFSPQRTTRRNPSAGLDPGQIHHYPFDPSGPVSHLCAIAAATRMRRNSRRISTYANLNFNSFRIRTYKNGSSQVSQNEHLQKKGGRGRRDCHASRLKPAIQEAAQNRERITGKCVTPAAHRSMICPAKFWGHCALAA